MKNIGIFTRIDKLNNKDILYIPQNIYNKFLGKVNIILVPFSNETAFSFIKTIIDKLDGVVLPGGDDIYPLEIKVSKYLYDNDKPLLGICLGMQTMAVAINGKLETMDNLSHKSLDKYVHDITINTNSLLYKILNKKRILVNSRHKDCITKTDLFIGAKNGNIIEEVEDKNKKFYMGFQWHPEDLNDVNSEKIFEFFINSL